ncbi:MAG: hypothetical protein GY861_24925 [bacterium]|nr:hypothetical protein [bacterium]
MIRKKTNFDYFIRNIEASGLLENFLVSAVVSIILIRFFLSVTGYPQLGGETLHIAHMLWGGLLMMVAILLLLGFLNREIKIAASVIGGIGFGVFIDELGKFITHNHNYFFQPSVAIIYLILIILFLIMLMSERFRKLSDKSYAINALEATKEVVLEDLDTKEKKRALMLLEKSDKKNPAVIALKKMLKSIRSKKEPNPNVLVRLKRFSSRLYNKIMSNETFRNVFLVLFILVSILNIVQAIFLESLFGLPSGDPLIQTGRLVSTGISWIFIIAGAYLILHKRFLEGYNRFKIATLIHIFITQFFIFYRGEPIANVGLMVNIITLGIVKFSIEQETVVEQKKFKS